MRKKIIKVLPWLLLSWGVMLGAILLTIQILEPDLRDEKPETGTNAALTSQEEAEDEGNVRESENTAEEAAAAEREALLEQRSRLEELEEQEIWEKLGEYNLVLIGDSRVVGFSLYGFVEDRRVLAANGATIDDLARQIDSAAGLAPDYVFIAYGINDIKERLGRTPEGYADYVQSKIRPLQEKLPEAVIFVHSVLPAREFLYSETPVYREVGDYNLALKEMCARNGWPFVDNSAAASEHAGLYANDGIHLGAGFYKFWGQNMLLAIFDEEHGLQ